MAITTRPGRAMAVGVTMLLTGAAAQAQSGDNQDRENVGMSQRYEIGIEADGQFARLAAVEFDATHAGVLELGAPHPESRRLVMVWTDLIGRESLRIKGGKQVVEADGSTKHIITRMDVPRGASDYPDTLMRLLYRDHGFVYRSAPP